ncbi:MAG TPA: hypothetical protein PK156_07885 [Polyangium sp.]|nr:hypothetical protein [Polyangium sp.]
MPDKRYPGFVTVQWHCVDGRGLQRLRKDHHIVLVAAGPDAPLVELLVSNTDKPWRSSDFIHEEGWFCAERIGDEWSVSLEGGGGQFSMPHAMLLGLCEVIDALQLGNTPDLGEALDADEWDRRFGWARESGLLDSRVAEWNELARGYVERLRQEGVVPGLNASGALLAAREAIVTVLDEAGLARREQPDAIFYQLGEHNAGYLKEVIDALDMQFGLSQCCAEVVPKPGTAAFRQHIFMERPAQPGEHQLALDWWILDPDYPHDGMFGTLNFAHYCHQVFLASPRMDLDPVPFDLFGKRLYLLIGCDKRGLELRSAISEDAFLEHWVCRVREHWAAEGHGLAPALGADGLSEVFDAWRLPTVLRVFLERIGNGGVWDSVRWLAINEILRENDLDAWLRPCPVEILEAHEMVDWEYQELPDGLLCISHYFYNASRAYLLADGRVVWATPTETGYVLDPPHLWLWT